MRHDAKKKNKIKLNHLKAENKKLLSDLNKKSEEKEEDNSYKEFEDKLTRKLNKKEKVKKGRKHRN